MIIGKRVNPERYRLRSVAGGYGGDVVQSHERYIGGSLYTFSRTLWADGGITIRAYWGLTTTVLHEWEG